MKHFGAAVALGLVLGTVGYAQQLDPAPRPQFLQAMGLLDTETLSVTNETMGKPVALPFTIRIPSSTQIEARTKTDAEGALLAIEFAAPDGAFVESVIFTEASVDLSDPQTRLFGMANLLVLKAYPAILQPYPDARILGFGATEVAGMPAVQLIGTHSASPLGPVLFRLVGYLPPDSAQTVVALASLSGIRMPARGDDQLKDSFSGMTLESLSLEP